MLNSRPLRTRGRPAPLHAKRWHGAVIPPLFSPASAAHVALVLATTPDCCTGDVHTVDTRMRCAAWAQTRCARGRAVLLRLTDGYTALGTSSPAYPALHRQVPTSSTSALTSSAAREPRSFAAEAAQPGTSANQAKQRLTSSVDVGHGAPSQRAAGEHSRFPRSVPDCCCWFPGAVQAVQDAENSQPEAFPDAGSWSQVRSAGRKLRLLRHRRQLLLNRSGPISPGGAAMRWARGRDLRHRPGGASPGHRPSCSS